MLSEAIKSIGMLDLKPAGGFMPTWMAKDNYLQVGYVLS
jgi:hypothetical protein